MTLIDKFVYTTLKLEGWSSPPLTTIQVHISISSCECANWHPPLTQSHFLFSCMCLHMVNLLFIGIFFGSWFTRFRLGNRTNIRFASQMCESLVALHLSVFFPVPLLTMLLFKKHMLHTSATFGKGEAFGAAAPEDCGGGVGVERACVKADTCEGRSCVPAVAGVWRPAAGCLVIERCRIWLAWWQNKHNKQ